MVPEHGDKRPFLDLRTVQLATWLPEITLPGAAALTAQPWGTRFDFEIIPLPLTAPQPRSSPLAHGGYLDELLPRLRVRSSSGGPERPLSKALVQMLPVLMAPGGVRSDGLPRWDNSPDITRRAHVRGSTWASGRFARDADDVIWDEPEPPEPPSGGTTVRMGHRRLSGVKRNDRRIAREMLAAVAYDIKDEPRERIARGLLVLGDNREYDSRGFTVKRSQGTDKAIVRGRAMLCELGAWPWAHAPGGQLPKRELWRTDPAFTGPLESWARTEIENQHNKILRARRVLGDPRQG